MKTYFNITNGHVFKVNERGAIYILSNYDNGWKHSSRNADDGLGLRDLSEIHEWI